MKPEIDGRTPEEFWQDRYAKDTATTGKPTHTLETYVRDREPGEALDLGCARGDDVVWLARRGWRVLGVDIAEGALRHTAANAERSGVTDHVRLERHDLADSFPTGDFDLVTASFLQTPFDFPWDSVIRRAAAAVRPGGLLITVTHQRVAPWSPASPKLDLPDAGALLATLDLEPAHWHRIFVGSVDRTAKLPDGQTAPVTDAVIVLERRTA